MSSELSRVVVVVSPNPLPAAIAQDEWPLHVTVAPMFDIGNAELGDVLSDVLESVASHLQQFEFELGEPDRFGPAGMVPVLLVAHPLFREIHAGLSAALSELPDFTPVEPEHWGEGYRPHVSLNDLSHSRPGDYIPARTLTAFHLTDRWEQEAFTSLQADEPGS